MYRLTAWAALPNSGIVALSMIACSSAWSASLDHGGLGFLFDEPITTSVSGTPMRESDVPVNMTIITAEEIRRAGAMTIPDLLQFYGSIDVLQNTANGYAVGIRGYNQPNNPRLLVMVNGRPVYLDYFGITAWSALPVEKSEIRQIEIVRGPNTALLGFNAASGVINFITYNPIYDDVTELGINVGTKDTVIADGIATVSSFGEYGVRISASQGELGNHDDDRANALDAQLDVDADREFLGIQGVVALTDTLHLEVEGGTVNARYNELLSSGAYANADYGIDHFRGRLFWDSDYGLSSLDGYKVMIDQATVRNRGGFNLLASGKTVTQAVSASHQFTPLAGHDVRIGGEFRDITGRGPRSQNTDVGYHIYSLNGAWNWTITDDLSAMASLRYDDLKFRYGGDEVILTENQFEKQTGESSYNLAAVYKLTENDTFKISAAQGVQTPSILELAFFIPGTPATGGVPITGNPDLDSTILKSREINYERKFREAETVFNASLFMQELESLKSLSGGSAASLIINNGQPALAANNVGDSESWGVELGLDGKFAETGRFGLNYTYQEIDDDLDFNPLDFPVLYEGATPKHRVNARLGYGFGSWQADVYGFWQSSRDALFTDPVAGTEIIDIDPSFNVNARVAYQVDEKLEFGLTGFNLLGETSDTAGTDIDTRVVVSARIKLN